MKITEQDIFNYVYYTAKLSPEKQQYIKSNRNFFEKQITLCEDTFSALNQEKSALNNIIILNKKAALNLQKEQEYFLAADSISLDKSIRTETYTDSKNNFLVKVIFYQDKTRLFIFNEENKPIYNFRLNIKPLNRTYQIENSSEPIELPAGLEINSIELEM